MTPIYSFHKLQAILLIPSNVETAFYHLNKFRRCINICLVSFGMKNEKFNIKKMMNVILKEIIIFISSGSWTIFLANRVRNRHLLCTSSCLRIQLIQNKSSISQPLVGMNRENSTRTQCNRDYQKDQHKLHSSSSTSNHRPYTDTF